MTTSLRQESRPPWMDPRLLAVVVVSSAAVLATYLVVGGWKASHATPKDAPKTIDVEAQASAHAKPDHLTMTFTVHGRSDADQNSALDALHTNIGTVHEFLTAHGIADAELTFGAASSERENEDVTNHDSDGNASTESVPGDWVASQDVNISLTDIKRGIALHEAAAVTGDWNDVDVGDAQCTSANSDALEKQVLFQARQNVRTQALQAVDQYGGSLGKLSSAQIGNVSTSTDCSDVVVSASATASYELE